MQGAARKNEGDVVHPHGLAQPAREERLQLVAVHAPGHGRRAVVGRFHPAMLAQGAAREAAADVVEHEDGAGKTLRQRPREAGHFLFAEIHEQALGGDEAGALWRHGAEPGGGVQSAGAHVQVARVRLDETLADGKGLGHIHADPQGLGRVNAVTLGFQPLAQIDDGGAGMGGQKNAQVLIKQLRAHAVRAIGMAKVALVVVMQGAVDVQAHGIAQTAVRAGGFAGAVVQSPEHGFGNARQAGLHGRAPSLEKVMQ